MGDNVEIRGRETQTQVLFAYFHSLYKPHIEPHPTRIPQEESLVVEGDTVLRFGMLEGDAIVHANKAIYDPQSRDDFPDFRENGSNAKHLAIVLNEHELGFNESGRNIQDRVKCVMDEQEASVVVVKRGPFGSIVFTVRDVEGTAIPAYFSPRVFKIGSGDVFSAVFSYFWGEKQTNPVEAADLASRFVSTYCGTRSFSAVLPADMLPVGGNLQGSILLVAKLKSISHRWLVNETEHCVKELGAQVKFRDSGFDIAPDEFRAILVLLDTFDWCDRPALLGNLKETEENLVVFSETKEDWPEHQLTSWGNLISDDFASAIYHSIWAACKDS